LLLITFESAESLLLSAELDNVNLIIMLAFLFLITSYLTTKLQKNVVINKKKAIIFRVSNYF